MQLYKSRGFGEFFQDTFSFIRQNGGHLYKNFFIVNGIFILILMVLMYFFSKFYTDVVFGGLVNNNPNALDNYLNDNIGVMTLFFFLFIVLGLISAAVSYSYIPIYLKLYAKNNDKTFNASDIINEYKANIGKILVFIIFAIIVAIPIFIVAGITSLILAITFIGILLIPLVIGAVSLLYQGTLMEYIEHKKSIWTSFGYSWQLMGSKFWAAIGSAGLFFLMSYIAQNVIALIPYFFFIVDMLTSIETNTNPDPQEIGKSLSLIMIVIFMLTYFVSTVLGIIVQANQGIVFYSLKEEQENINTKSDIDLIGTSE